MFLGVFYFARPEGFEPFDLRIDVRHSIQLSYGRVFYMFTLPPRGESMVMPINQTFSRLRTRISHGKSRTSLFLSSLKRRAQAK